MASRLRSSSPAASATPSRCVRCASSLGQATSGTLTSRREALSPGRPAPQTRNANCRSVPAHHHDVYMDPRPSRSAG